MDEIIIEIARESTHCGIRRLSLCNDMNPSLEIVEKIAKAYEPKFIMSPKAKEMYEDIMRYFMGDTEFKGDLNKGILLMGSIGSGKTLAMKVMKKLSELCPIPYYKNGRAIEMKFDILSVHEIVKLFMAKGFEGIKPYENRYMLCLDDIGAEAASVKYYGNEIDIIGSLLTSRCKDGLLTFATTNFPEKILEEKYEDRVVSRMHQMFNFLTIREKDFRRG